MTDPICARCRRPVSPEDRAPIPAGLVDLLLGDAEVIHIGCLSREETIATVERFVNEHERAARWHNEQERAEENQTAAGRALLKVLYEQQERERASELPLTEERDGE